MMFAFLLFVFVSVVGVTAAYTPRNVDSEEDETGRVNSTAVKAIVIGIILFICAFVSLHLYRKCVTPIRSSPAPSYAATPSAFGNPVVERPRRVSRPSQYIAYPSSIPSITVSSIHPVDSSPKIPHIPRKVHAVKTKITAPVAGRRLPSFLKAVA